MLAERKYYAYDYEMGTAVKKKEEYDVPKRVVKQRKNVVKQAKPKQISNKAKVSTILWILSMFALLMILIYRFNIINEKNLQVQSLKKELLATQASVANAQVEVEQSIDLNKIEAYAKQQLGMQKPDKNQMIYIDNSNSNSVQTQNSTTMINKVLDKVKQIINQVF